MFSKIKLIIGLVSVILVILGVWLNPYTITKKSVLKKYETDRFNDSTSIVKLGIELKDKNSFIFSIQQDLDICTANDSKLKIIIAEQQKEIKALKNQENTCCEELKHLEETENIQYYTKDCLSKWYKRVLKKPENIRE